MLRRTTILLALAGAGAALPSTAAAARPDLVTAAVGDPPRTVAAGAAFRVTDTARNRGRGPAGASTTRFYLSPNAPRSLRERRASTTDPRTAATDVLLGGGRAVPALRAGGRSRARRATTLVVPGATRPGVYALLGCADDRGAVRESAEDRNCRVAKRRVTVTAPAPGDVVAMSDADELPDEAEARTALQLFSATRCAAGPALRSMTVPAAVRSLRGALTRTVGAAAMRAFVASPEYRDAGRAQRASLGALMVARPGAALVASLRAHELQPRRAAHLRNAATVAASMGYPSEALALLDGAARLDDAPRSGLGIAAKDAAQAIRGQALGMAGRWAQAAPRFEAALAAEPLLAEAAAGAAAAEACTRGPEAALQQARRSRARRTPVPELDLSRGVAHPMRKLHLPFSPEQAAPARDVFRAEGDALVRELARLGARRTAHEEQLRAQEATTTPATRRRLASILRRVERVAQEPDVVAAQQRVDDLLAAPDETTYAFWGNGDQEHRYQEFQDAADATCQGDEHYSTCFTAKMREQCIPALRVQHQRWADQVFDLYRAAEARHALFSRRVSALGAQLAGPQATGLIRTIIEEDEVAQYTAARGSAVGWTVPLKAAEDYCVEQPLPEAPAPDAAGAASSEECSPLARTMSGTAKLDSFTLKVKCEGVELGGTLPVAPWFAGFATATYDVRTGRLTIFTGAQVKVDTLQVVKGSFKSGIYLTVDRDGIQDVGWRTGPSATGGAGPAEFSLFKDEIDMTFVGAFDHLTGVR